MRATTFAFTLLVVSGFAFAQDGAELHVGDTRISVTIGEVVTWLAMGVIVCSLVTAIGIFGSREMTRGRSLVLGLIGALAGGFLVDALGVRLDLGAIVIQYEELLAALVGALVLLFVRWFLFSRRKKRA